MQQKGEIGNITLAFEKESRVSDLSKSFERRHVGVGEDRRECK